MGDLQRLPNIGRKLEQALNEAGIESIEDLDRLGSRQAFQRLQANEPDSCLTRLYALEGAVRRVRWHTLPEEVRKQLSRFFNTSKQS